MHEPRATSIGSHTLYNLINEGIYNMFRPDPGSSEVSSGDSSSSTVPPIESHNMVQRVNMAQK